MFFGVSGKRAVSGRRLKSGNLKKSRQEQEKAVNFFECLDNLITIHERKRNALKNAKKFLQDAFA